MSNDMFNFKFILLVVIGGKILLLKFRINYLIQEKFSGFVNFSFSVAEEIIVVSYEKIFHLLTS